MDNPYEWLQDFIAQVPDILQPLIVALAGAVPYIEGEGAAAFGIIAGINPIVAAVAAATGNILCVLGVVVLGSRLREGVVARRAAGTGRARADRPVVAAAVGGQGGGTRSHAGAPAATAVVVDQGAEQADDTNAKPTRRAKGRARLRGWMVRFGVPGASILAPLALPTMLTAAFFVASGVPKHWVILWQVVAIVSWTSAIAIATTGVLTLVGW
ncbi:hypothetical protein GCM10009616_08990 [Microlunatus lacustris]